MSSGDATLLSSMRYLFVVPPFYSHIQPTVAVGRELARRGHAVAWVSYAPMKRVLPADAAFYALDAKLPEHAIRELCLQAGAPFLAGMKVLFESILMPMAADMLPGVEAAIEAFAPDALIVDQQTFAGAIAARRRGLPWATSATTSALYDDALRDFPKVKAWLSALFESLQREAGLPIESWPDRSTSLVVLYASRLFAGPNLAFPPHYRFVGPALEGRAESSDFPWDELRPGRRVFVSLGTIFAHRGERFFRTTIEALADIPEQVILHAPPEFNLPAPSHFIVRPWVPLMQLFPKLDALVSHAGTTILEGMAHGIPAVVAPVTQDQFTFAHRATESGAARRVTFNRVTPAQLRDAVRDVLDNPTYAQAAQRMQASFREAGGAPAAASAIEAMK